MFTSRIIFKKAPIVPWLAATFSGFVVKGELKVHCKIVTVAKARKIFFDFVDATLFVNWVV